MTPMGISKPRRLGRHFLTDHLSGRRKFSTHVLKRIEAVVAAGERLHEGQVRFAIEASLPLAQVFRGLEPRARALQLFGQLGVWDTEHNNGVLVYVLLADRDVEIVADRGINRRVPQEAWDAICRGMERAFGEGRFEEGAIDGVSAVGDLLVQHFPRSAVGPNELPDTPIIL